MEAGTVPVVLDGAEVEEEPSPNLIDHHLLQSYKTLHQKLTKKCAVPIFHLCSIIVPIVVG